MSDFLSQLEQSFTPVQVSIEEFAESAAYCGLHLYPGQRVLLKLIFLEELTPHEDNILESWIKGKDGEVRISPMIRERVDWLRANGYKHFREMVLVGGRRSSKGFVTGITLAKIMYDCLQLQDPGQYYGIPTDKQIYFPCVAAALDQARKYQYADFSTTVSSCVAFQNNLTKVFEKEFSVATESDLRKMASHKRRGANIGRDASKLRGVAQAANAPTLRGMAAMAIVFDEMAHMEAGEENDASAEKCYDAAIPALAQFGRDAFIACNSSPYTKLGRFFERVAQAMKLERRSGEEFPASATMFAFQFPSWALFERWQDDPKSKYIRRCITVSPDWDPDEKNKDGSFYHPVDDQQAILISRDEEKENPDVYKVERRGQFAEVIDAYLKPEMVDRCFSGIPYWNPEAGDNNEGGWEYNPLKTNWQNSSYYYQYKAHLDPSSTTAGFGFALAHCEEIPDINGMPQVHVVFDIVKRWNPREFPNGVIDWDVVLDEVMLVVNLFRPYEVTFDQFNSAYPIQWLNSEMRKRNIGGVRVYEKTATSQSNWDRAEIFKTALYRDLVHTPNDTKDIAYAGEELKHLQQVNTQGKFPRVEKQDIGPVQTKDMADCMMACVEGLIGNLIARASRSDLAEGSRVGAPGGFQIGGHDAGGRGRSNPFAHLMSDRRKGEQGVGRGGSPSARPGGRSNPARRSGWSRSRGRWR